MNTQAIFSIHARGRSAGTAGTCLFLIMLICFLPTEAFAESKEELIIFHAGSLSMPFKDMAEAFTEKHSGISVYREAAGSRTCARKISELNRKCDVMGSADYTVIESLLFPDHADWNISFATNEMAIMYRHKSPCADRINSANWYEILLREDVEYGHSDPNMDPCGYRSQLVWQLAELHYGVGGLYKRLQENCPRKNIRPKETELISLLETGQIDYLFIYRSVCEQHNMPFVELPDKINLRSSEYTDFYKKAQIEITGKKPGEYIIKKGRPMVYGMTIPKGAPNRDDAVDFVAFVIGPEGRKIMNQNGQPPIVPPEVTGKAEILPSKLKRLVQ